MSIKQMTIEYANKREKKVLDLVETLEKAIEAQHVEAIDLYFATYLMSIISHKYIEMTEENCEEVEFINELTDEYLKRYEQRFGPLPESIDNE